MLQSAQDDEEPGRTTGSSGYAELVQLREIEPPTGGRHESQVQLMSSPDSILNEAMQEEAAGLDVIMEENRFADEDDSKPQSPAPYMVSRLQVYILNCFIE